eukprot:EG_transcript_2659
MACSWPVWCTLFKKPASLDPDLAQAVTTTLVHRLVDTDLTVKTIRAHLEKVTLAAVRAGARSKDLDVHTEAINKRLDEFLELSQSAVRTIQNLSEEVRLLAAGPDQASSSGCSPARPPPRKPPTVRPPANTGPDIREKYSFATVIGQGSCAQVFRATALHTGHEYAIKVVDRKLVGEKAWRIAIQEAKVLRQLHHPHIINLVDCVERGGVMYMVMELLHGGDLFEKLVRLRQYSEQVAARLTRNVLHAVAYMHDVGIVHRDIKPENVMLKEDTSDVEPGDQERLANVSLIDFGFARFCAPRTATLTDCCGTVEYIAPEILLCWMGQRAGYGHACDMWSIGVMTYKLLSGSLPFVASQEEQIMMKVLRGRFDFPSNTVWDRVSDQAKSFISQLLVLDPAQRMSARDALTHPWIAGLESLPSYPLETQVAAPHDTVRLLRALPHAQRHLMVKTRVPTGDLKHCHLGDVVPLQIYALMQDVSVDTALHFLTSQRLRCCPVVSSGGHFLGFFHVQQVVRLVVDNCREPLRVARALEVGRRAELSNVLALKEHQAATFGRSVAEVVGRGWPPPSPPFTLSSNLLDVIRKGFLRPGLDGTYPDRAPLLSASATHATHVMVVHADGSLRQGGSEGPYISGVVTSHNILQLLSTQPAIVGQTLWNTPLQQLGLLTKRAWAVPSTMAALMAFHVMLEEHAVGVAVLDEQARIQCSLSPADFLGVTPRCLPTLALPVEHFLQAQAKTVKDVSAPPTLSEDRCTLGDAIQLLVTAKAPCLYVVNAHQRPIAVVTHTEILAVVAQHAPVNPDVHPSSPLHASVERAFSWSAPSDSPAVNTATSSARCGSALNEGQAL